MWFSNLYHEFRSQQESELLDLPHCMQILYNNSSNTDLQRMLMIVQFWGESIHAKEYIFFSKYGEVESGVCTQQMSVKKIVYRLCTGQ